MANAAAHVAPYHKRCHKIYVD